MKYGNNYYITCIFLANNYPFSAYNFVYIIFTSLAHSATYYLFNII